MKCGRRRGHQLDHTSLLLEQASGPWTLHRYAVRIPVLHTRTLVIVGQLFLWSLRSSFPSSPIIHPISHPVLSLIPSWVCSHTFPADHSRPFFLLPFLLAFLLRCQIYLLAFAAVRQLSFITAALLRTRPRRLLSNVDHPAPSTHSLQIPLADQ